MYLLRIFTVLFAFFVFGLGALCLGFIIFPLVSIFAKKNNKQKTFVFLIHKSWKIFRYIMVCLQIIKFEFPHIKFMQQLRGKIIVSNHPSLIDIVILISSIPNSISVVKSELASNFFVRNIILNAYLINDSDVDKFKNNAKVLLQNGFNIVIFPTGTRTLNNEIPKIHQGAAALAIENNVEIIPLKINVSAPFLTKNNSIYKSAAKEKVLFKIETRPVIKPNEILLNEPDYVKARKIISNKIKEACFK